MELRALFLFGCLVFCIKGFKIVRWRDLKTERLRGGVMERLRDGEKNSGVQLRQF